MGVPAWPVETSERGNLLLWNTSTELLLREEFSDRMLFIIRQTEAHASPFSWASSVRKCLGFTSRISQKKNVLLQSSPLPQDVAKQTQVQFQ